MYVDKLRCEKQEAIPLDIDRGEVQKALEGAKQISEEFGVMVLLSIMTGIRRGERRGVLSRHNATGSLEVRPPL